MNESVKTEEGEAGIHRNPAENNVQEFIVKKIKLSEKKRESENYKCYARRHIGETLKRHSDNVFYYIRKYISQKIVNIFCGVLRTWFYANQRT